MEMSHADIDRAIGLLQALPAEQRRAALEFIEELASPASAYVLSDDELSICEAAMAGPSVPEHEVDELLNTSWR
jgi:hypothetical protein